MSDHDQEIRTVESRLQAERIALAAGVRQLGASARDALVSPRGLLAAAGVGFLLGEALRPFRQPAPTRQLGLAGTLGAAALSLVRARYGSPWQLVAKGAQAVATRAHRRNTDAPADHGMSNQRESARPGTPGREPGSL